MQKSNCLVLKSADYNEADKLLSLYSAELGKFSAVIRGVKKANARLKVAAEPFCFGEYFLEQRGTYRIVTNCNVIESFYTLRTEYELLKCASVVIDVLNNCGNENDVNAPLFLTALRCLQQLDEQAIANKLLVLKFLLDACAHLGIKPQLKRCVSCGNTHATRFLVNILGGGVVCPPCADSNSITIDPPVLSCLRFTADTSIQRLHTLKFSDQVTSCAIGLVGEYFRYKFVQLKTLTL